LPGSSFREAQDWVEAVQAIETFVGFEGAAYVPGVHAVVPGEEVWL